MNLKKWFIRFIIAGISTPIILIAGIYFLPESLTLKYIVVPIVSTLTGNKKKEIPMSDESMYPDYNQQVTKEEIIGIWKLTNKTCNKRFPLRESMQDDNKICKDTLVKFYKKGIFRCKGYVHNDTLVSFRDSVGSWENNNGAAVISLYKRSKPLNDIYFDGFDPLVFKQYKNILYLQSEMFKFDDYTTKELTYEKIEDFEELKTPKLFKPNSSEIIGDWVLSKESQTYIEQYFKNPIKYDFTLEADKKEIEERTKAIKNSYVRLRKDGSVTLRSLHQDIILQPYFLETKGKWSLDENSSLSINTTQKKIYKNYTLNFTKENGSLVMWQVYGVNGAGTILKYVQRDSKLKDKRVILKAKKGEIVTINGLEYQNQPFINVLSWERAAEYCGILNLNGKGWRLPNRKELLELSPSSYEPIKMEFRENMSKMREGFGKKFWTDKEIDINHAKVVQFYESSQAITIDDRYKVKEEAVLCVRYKTSHRDAIK